MHMYRDCIYRDKYTNTLYAEMLFLTYSFTRTYLTKDPLRHSLNFFHDLKVYLNQVRHLKAFVMT